MASNSSIYHARQSEGTRSLAFEEVRCQRCGRLLLRWHMSGSSQLEVKCPRCQMLNLFTSDEGGNS